MIKIRMILFAVFTVILLGACGGGGNSGDALTGSANEDEPDRGTTTPSEPEPPGPTTPIVTLPVWYWVQAVNSPSLPVNSTLLLVVKPYLMAAA